MNNNLYAVYRVTWEESEAGWGIRPDGASYHVSIAEAQAFIKAYWDGMPKDVPSEYSFPSSNSPELVAVTKDFYEEVQKDKSVRKWQCDVKKVEIR